jgi:hypothetical protein
VVSFIPRPLCAPGKNPVPFEYEAAWIPELGRQKFGGVVVSVLATGPKGRGFETGQDNGFLRAMKICSTYSFEREVKPEFPFRTILRHVKDLLKSHGEG